MKVYITIFNFYFEIDEFTKLPMGLKNYHFMREILIVGI